MHRAGPVALAVSTAAHGATITRSRRRAEARRGGGEARREQSRGVLRLALAIADLRRIELRKHLIEAGLDDRSGSLTHRRLDSRYPARIARVARKRAMPLIRLRQIAKCDEPA